MASTFDDLIHLDVDELRKHMRTVLPHLTLQPKDIEHYMRQYAGISKSYSYENNHFGPTGPFFPHFYTQRFHTVILFPAHGIAVRFHNCVAREVLPQTMGSFSHNDAELHTVTYYDPVLGQKLSGARVWVTSLDPAAIVLPGGESISSELVRSCWWGRGGAAVWPSTYPQPCAAGADTSDDSGGGTNENANEDANEDANGGASFFGSNLTSNLTPNLTDYSVGR